MCNKRNQHITTYYTNNKHIYIISTIIETNRNTYPVCPISLKLWSYRILISPGLHDVSFSFEILGNPHEPTALYLVKRTKHDNFTI